MLKSLNRDISAPIAIVIIVFCTLLVGGVIVYQYYGIPKEKEKTLETTKPPEDETPEDETTDWEVYRNEVYGYELKYYKDWTYKEAGPYTYFFPEVYEGVQLTAIQAQVFIWNENLNQPKEGRKLNIEEHLCVEKCPPEIIYSLKENSKIAILKLNIQEEICGHMGCIEQRSVYSFSDSEIENITHQMLSTFRFIEVDETADWKTYRNEEYSFEFKYPPIPSGCEYCKIESNGSFRVNTTSLTITDSEGLNLSEFVDKEMKEFEITNKREILIGGEEGISVNYRFGGTARFGSAAFIKRGNKIFVFNFTAGAFCCGPKIDIIYEEEVYTAMLSTFRFIEVDETADWKTCRNEEYGYEIKYPEDWSAYDGTENDCFAKHPCLFSLNLISPIATGWVNVEVFDNSEKLSLRDWLEKYKLGEIKTEKFIDEIEVSGNNGIRLRYTPIARGYMLNYIYLSREEFIHEISFITEIDNPPEVENAIDQMFSTFRFLE